MADVIITGLDEQTMQRLEARAAFKGVTLEEAARELIVDAFDVDGIRRKFAEDDYMRRTSLIGSMKGMARIHGDIVTSDPSDWEESKDD